MGGRLNWAEGGLGLDCREVSGGEWIAVAGRGSEGVGTDIKNCAAMLELELIVRRGDLGDRSLASIAQTTR